MNTQPKVATSGNAQPPSSVRMQREFTIEEHLRVQRQIEQRAYIFWRAHGDSASNAFNNWLTAEVAVLVDFVKTRMAASSGMHIRTRLIRPSTSKLHYRL
jgi:hypothetical protein